jgi:hypothetical protein
MTVRGVALAAAGTAAGRETPRRDTDPATQPQLTQAQHREAVEYGAQAHRRLGPGAAWSDAEPSLRKHWSSSGRSRRTEWDLARDAVRAGWEGDA